MTSSHRVAIRWLRASTLITIPYLQAIVEAVVSAPLGWGESSPTAHALRRLIRSIEYGNIDPFPVSDLEGYLVDRGVDVPEELALLRQVPPPKPPKQQPGPKFFDAWRTFERATGKSTRLVNIDMDRDDHLAPALLAVAEAVAKLPRPAARLWASEVKKVVLRSGSRGSEDASWDPGGSIVLVLSKSQSVEIWRMHIVHELGHALEDKLGLTITAWDTTPYGQPPYVSAYADSNAAEDFAETFRALLMEPALLRRKAPAKYDDMRGRI